MSNNTKVAEPIDSTEVQFGIRAMLIVMSVVAVAVSSVAAYIRTFPVALQNELALYWSALAAFIAAIIVIHAWRRRRAEKRAGHILFELNHFSFYLPHASRLAMTLAGTVSLLAAPAMWLKGSHDIGVGNSLSAWLSEFNYATIVCVVATGGGVTYFWWRRIRLSENGLIARSQFFPWAVCNRWEWNAAFKNVAVVTTTTRGRIAFEVPEQDRAAVEELLKREVYVRFKRKGLIELKCSLAFGPFHIGRVDIFRRLGRHRHAAFAVDIRARHEHRAR